MTDRQIRIDPSIIFNTSKTTYSTIGGGVVYTTPGTTGPMDQATQTRIDTLEAQLAAAVQKAKEQEELIAILTEGLTSVREEMQGVSEGVKRLVGERDYWKEIARNVQEQRQAFLDEEEERLKAALD